MLCPNGLGHNSDGSKMLRTRLGFRCLNWDTNSLIPDLFLSGFRCRHKSLSQREHSVARGLLLSLNIYCFWIRGHDQHRTAVAFKFPLCTGSHELTYTSITTCPSCLLLKASKNAVFDLPFWKSFTTQADFILRVCAAHRSLCLVPGHLLTSHALTDLTVP